jgi:hypothetical protein
MSLRSNFKSYSKGKRKAKRLVRGVGLAHVTPLNKSQIAVVAAIARQSSQARLAKVLGVSGPLISQANGLTPRECQEVMTGRVRVGHYAA